MDQEQTKMTMMENQNILTRESHLTRRIEELEVKLRDGGLPGFDLGVDYLNTLVWAGNYDGARKKAEQWHCQDRKNPYLAYHFARFLTQEDEPAGLKWYADLSRQHRADTNWAILLATLQTDFGHTKAGLETVLELLNRSSGWPLLLATYAFNSLYVPDIDPVENLAVMKRLVPRHLGVPTALPGSVSRRPRYSIGFVCGNLRQHAISAFFIPLLANLDRKKFMVVVFSSCVQADSVTQELQKNSDLWYDTAKMSDSELLALIRSDHLDLLVDLDNYTHPNRLAVFAQRAAPIQLSFYGLNMSTGIDSMDYRLTDAAVDPPGNELHYAEKLLRTRHSHIAYMGTSFAPTELPMLSNGHLTFGSFNDWKKVDSAQITQWAELLRKFPDCHLNVVGFRDALAAMRVQRQLSHADIELNRLSIVGRIPPRDFYKHIQSVDIAIDSWPFGGGVTTATTLSLGVPLITAAGLRAHSRVSASMLGALGLERYVVGSPDRLASGAAAICTNPDSLKADRLRITQCFAETIGNGERLAAEVGELLIRAIERHRKGKPPEHDAL